LKTLEDDALWKVDFIRKGIEVSSKAFMDYVLQCTFQIVGFVGSNSNTGVEFTALDYSIWLWSLAVKQIFHKKLQFSILVKPLNLTLGF
jgi:hypothetical protein